MDHYINHFLSIFLCHLTLYPTCPAKSTCQLLGQSLWADFVPAGARLEVWVPHSLWCQLLEQGASRGQLPQWVGHLCLSPLWCVFQKNWATVCDQCKWGHWGAQCCQLEWTCASCQLLGEPESASSPDWDGCGVTVSFTSKPQAGAASNSGGLGLGRGTWQGPGC